MPASSASRAVWLAPGLASRMKARHTSAPAATIAALRAILAAPVDQSAGWRSTCPPHERQSRSAMASAPRGQAPLTSTAPGWQCSRNASAMTVLAVQVREPVTSTRRAAWLVAGRALAAAAQLAGSTGLRGLGLPASGGGVLGSATGRYSRAGRDPGRASRTGGRGGGHRLLPAWQAAGAEPVIGRGAEVGRSAAQAGPAVALRGRSSRRSRSPQSMDAGRSSGAVPVDAAQVGVELPAEPGPHAGAVAGAAGAVGPAGSAALQVPHGDDGAQQDVTESDGGQAES